MGSCGRAAGAEAVLAGVAEHLEARAARCARRERRLHRSLLSRAARRHPAPGTPAAELRQHDRGAGRTHPRRAARRPGAQAPSGRAARRRERLGGDRAETGAMDQATARRRRRARRRRKRRRRARRLRRRAPLPRPSDAQAPGPHRAAQLRHHRSGGDRPLPRARRLPGARGVPRAEPGGGHRRGQARRPARPRRRRLPDLAEVDLLPRDARATSATSSATPTRGTRAPS